MCGGRGTRLGGETEKPRYTIDDVPMVQRVLTALEASRIETVYAAVSAHAPATREYLKENEAATTVDTPGSGYVADLQHALTGLDTPILTVAADLPLLDAVLVDRVLDRFDGRNLTVVVPTALKDALGASCDTAFDGRAPTGVNVVADTDAETMYTTYDARLAVNVNRPADADLAEALCD